MSDITKAYDMAALAEACYVLFHKIDFTVSDKVEDALKNSDLHGGFSATQAADFVANWEVKSHQGNTSSGFSATLFKNKKTGEYVYATRGTEPDNPLGDILSADIGDLVTDGLAFKQIIDMYNDWSRIRTAKGETYLAAQLDFLATETTLLQAERVTIPGDIAGPYELLLRERGDVVIDGSLGIVYRIEEKVSTEVFGNSDPRAMGLGAIESGPVPLSATGHSLGGHLAVAFTRLFPETGVAAYTVNGAGYPTGLLPGLSGNAPTNIRNVFANLGGADSFNPASILNFYGSAAPEVVTMNNTLGLMQQGSHEEIYIEDWINNTLGHGKEQMTDALAVYDLFIRLDKRYQTGTPASVLSEIEKIFKAGSPTANTTFESIVNTLSKLLVSANATPLPANKREALYARIKQIRTAIDGIPVGSVTVDPLSIYPVSTIITMAQGGISTINDALAYRYALKELNAFAVRGLDYCNANKNGELDLLDPVTDNGTLSEAWLADRAAMLTWIIQSNTLDQNPVDATFSDGSVWHFSDLTTGKSVAAGQGLFPPRHYVVFGKDRADTITGGESADRFYGAGGNDAMYGYGGDDYLEGGKGDDKLIGGNDNDQIYGGIGDDTLEGGKGNDILYGGSGDDTYIYNIGDGKDTIIDQDNKGRVIIKRNGATILTSTLYKDKTNNIWSDATGKVQITHNSPWRVVLEDGGVIELGENFQDGDFGIHLTELVDVTTTDTIVGDFTPISAQPDEYQYDALGNVLENAKTDSLGNVICDLNIPATNRNDYLYDSAGNDRIQAGGGDDIINAHRGGDDILEGGAGSDIVADYGSDSNLLFGESQEEMATLINAGEVAECINEKGDLLSAGGGDDQLYGSNRNDALFGGGGDDLISGGGGDDIILADASIRSAQRSWEWHIDNSAFSNLDFVEAETGGIDNIYGGSGNDIIYAGGGNDSVDGGSGSDNIYGEGGDDFLTGGSGDDRLSGDADWLPSDQHGDDYVDGGDGNDLIGGNGGNDTLFGGAGVDELQGGTGDDYLVGETGDDFLLGNEGNDQLLGSEGSDELQGGTGNDYLDGGSGVDKLYGDAGSDELFGGDDDDMLFGGTDDDYLDGETGDDYLFGDIGNDQLMGGDGDDHLQGDDGNDYLDGEAGNDLMLGGAGNDEIYGSAGDDKLQGDAGDDYLDGGDGDDLLVGGDGSNELFGGAGNDILQGGIGDDYLEGGDGNDILVAGAGEDTLVGGAGDDAYFVNLQNGYARIYDDFSGAEQNVIKVEGLREGQDYTINYRDGGCEIKLIGSGNVNSGETIGGGLPTYGVSIGYATGNGSYGGGSSWYSGGGNWYGGGNGFVEGGGVASGNSGNGLWYDGPINWIDAETGTRINPGEHRDDNETDYENAKTVVPPRRRDPLVFDLDGDGAESMGVSLNRHFDHDADGLAEGTAWVGKDDGLLVLDRNGDGAITDGRELFGDDTLLETGLKATGGFAALKEFDANKDGVINVADSVFAGLRIWQDANGDAVSTAEELHELSSFGICEIRLEAAVLNSPDGNGNTVVRNGSFLRQDGSEGVIAEYDFKIDERYTVDNNPVDVPDDIAALPWLKGSGTVIDLHQAMAKGGTELRSLIEQFMDETDVTARNGQMEQILAVWTGNETVAHGSRGQLFDGQKLAVIEAFMGTQFFGVTGPNPSEQAAQILDRIYFRISESCYAHLMRQTHLAELYGQIGTVWDDNLHRMVADLSTVEATIRAALDADEVSGRELLSEFSRTFRIDTTATGLVYLNFRESFVATNSDLAWVIDSGGMPVKTGSLGTSRIDAILADQTQLISDISGGDGNDVLFGSSNGEMIRNNTGDSTIVAGCGDDYVYAGPGADILDGGGGNDYLYGDSGNDTYIFRRGSGWDMIYDYDTTINNSDTIYVGSFLSPDEISVKRVSDDLVLLTTDTNDQLRVIDWFRNKTSRTERVQFADGTVWDVNAIKAFALQGTEGNDTLTGYETGDVIAGLAGNDHLYGEQGDDILDGGKGDDYLSGGSKGGFDVLTNGNDTYLFGRGRGNDTIFDYDSTTGNIDIISLNDGIAPEDISLGRSDNNLFLRINDTGDTLNVHRWFDDEGGGAYRVERIRFADGTEWDVSEIQAKVLLGTPDNDILTGYLGDDTIRGMAGEDYLDGRDGDDLLDGGAGADVLLGGNGNDTYVFGRGYGVDVIIESMEIPTDRNTVEMTSDLLPTDISLGVAGKDLFLSIRGTTDRLQISDWVSDSFPKVENFRFSDGTVWDKPYIMAILTNPTGTDDYLVGTPGVDLIDGGGGNDTIFGLEGDDVLSGGEGGDRLYGEDGSDQLYGGDGDDYLYDDQGENYLSGGEGSDALLVNGGLNALEGGCGNDSLVLSNGTSSVSFGRGDGFDTIETVLRPWEVADDHVYFGDGITIDDLSIQINRGEEGYSYPGGFEGGYGGTYDNGRLQIAIGIGDNEGMLVEGVAFESNYGGEYGGTLSITDLSIRRFTFADGSELTLDEIIALADDGIIGEQYGGYEDRLLLGSVAGDSVHGGAGNEKIDARDNDDYLSGGEGDDALSGGSGQDGLKGDVGNDILAGCKGDDSLTGGYGSDVFVFNIGDGSDVITYQDRMSGDIDTISFGVGVMPEDIRGSFDSEGNLIFSIHGTTDSIRMQWFNPDDNYVAIDSVQIARIQFEDAGGNARIFDLAGIIDVMKDTMFTAGYSTPVPLFSDATSGFELTGSVAAAGGNYAVAYAQVGDLFAVPTYINGTFDDDTIIGRAGNDTIDSRDGFDTVIAGAGDDIIIGGPDDDVLMGGEGEDTYQFNLGDGQDLIDDIPTSMDPNTVLFGAGISPDDLTLDYDQYENQLIISIGTEGDALRLNGFYGDDPYGPHAIDYFRFDNGEVLTWNQMIGKGFDIRGSSYNDELEGTAAVDRITAGTGNDTLIGCVGNDMLMGGDGDDEYKFDAGDGIDQIDDVSSATGRNSIVFGEGIASSDITGRLTYRDNTLIVRVGTRGDEIHLTGFDPYAADSGRRAVQSFVFEDGSMMTYEDLVRNTFIIQGDYAGDDLYGTNLTDRLYGYEDSDILHGGEGNDTLTGGTEDDELYGGRGDDTYVFNLGDGVDLITDVATLEEANRILFGQGITLNDIRTQIDGSRLIIEYGDRGDSVILENFEFNAIDNSHVTEIIEFSDGSQVRLMTLVDSATEFDDYIVGDVFANVVNGKDGNDEIVAGDGDDTIFGGAGDDVLQTGEGEDILVGGQGTDNLVGGKGVDTYQCNLGDGSDTILDVSEKGIGNIVIFGAGITRDMVSTTIEGSTLTVRYGSIGDEIRVENYLSDDADGGYAISAFKFEDGQVISCRDLANRPPTIDVPLAALTATQDQPFAFQVPEDAFSDPDGDRLTCFVSATDADTFPQWLVFDPVSRTLSGTPGNADVGSYTVEVSVIDSLGAVASQSLTVTVENANDAPVVVIPLSDQTATEDQPFSFRIPEGTFSDIDAGDRLSYGATLASDDPLPAWLQFDAATGTFSGLPGNAEVGDIGVMVRATDLSGAVAQSSFTVTVANVNDAPVVASSLADQSATEGEPFSFQIPSGTFVDIDAGDQLSYAATLANGDPLPAWLQFDAVTGTFSGTPLAGSASTIDIRVSVSDQAGLAVDDTFLLATAPPPIIVGTAGNDTLTGSVGNDTLDGGGGCDTLLAGEGDDTLMFSPDYSAGLFDVAINVGSPGVWGSFAVEFINGKKMSYDLYDGGEDFDTLVGTDSDDAIFLDRGLLCQGPNIAGVEWIMTGAGNDLIDLTSYRYGYGDTILDGGSGNDVLWASSGNDLLSGGSGSDKMDGGAGNDILQGGADNDYLRGWTGKNLLDGGTGADILLGGSGNEQFIGGTGNDIIETGSGADIISFNRGDGADCVYGNIGTDNVLSLGGGIKYSDLSFRKSGLDLVLDAAGGDTVTLKGWYYSSCNRSVLTLQMIEEAAEDFNSGGDDLLRDNKVEKFNFSGLADKFDQALAANPCLTSWSLSSALTQFHLGGSDTEAIGGDLAYQYGKNGDLGGIGLAAAQDLLAQPQFGTAPQAFKTLSGLQEGAVTLG